MKKVVAKQDFMSSVFNFSLNTDEIENGDSGYEWDPFSIDDPFAVPSLDDSKNRVLRPGDMFRHPATAPVAPVREQTQTKSLIRHGKLNWRIDS